MAKLSLFAALAALVVPAVMLMAAPASAQNAPGMDFPPGTFQLAGMPVSCRNAVTRVVPSFSDAAAAMSPGDGVNGLIIINASAFSQMPAPLQLFTYAHECGHIVNGPNENAADCFAAKLGRAQGWLAPQDMSHLIRMFAGNPGDWSHAPGPVRLRNIWACYTSP